MIYLVNGTLLYQNNLIIRWSNFNKKTIIYNLSNSKKKYYHKSQDKLIFDSLVKIIIETIFNHKIH